MTITLTREEAQQVLDALETRGLEWVVAERKAKELLRARLAQPEPEPVAWIHRFIEGGISVGKKPVDLDKNPDRWMPVYRDPTPCQTCEALARTVMMDQTYHDNVTQQREFVGLTDEEISAVDWKQNETLHDFARAIEAKLKEKNT